MATSDKIEKSESNVEIEEDENESVRDEIQVPELNPNCKQRSVTSSRIGRTAEMCGLFAGLAVDTVSEYAKSVVGLSGATDMKSAVLNPKNMDRLVRKLCKLRGAAMKLGQILSMQNPKTISPELMIVFDRVRQSANYMPDGQMNTVMIDAFGMDWLSKFKSFANKPFAAASIGQVHKGILHSDVAVAVKIQYMNISKSVESDVSNLALTLRMFNLCPTGQFFDDIMEKVKRELSWEVDYLREADFQKKYRGLIEAHTEFYVPKVFDEVSTEFVLTTELVPVVPVDKCIELK